MLYTARTLFISLRNNCLQKCATIESKSQYPCQKTLRFLSNDSSRHGAEIRKRKHKLDAFQDLKTCSREQTSDDENADSSSSLSYASEEFGEESKLKAELLFQLYLKMEEVVSKTTSVELLELADFLNYFEYSGCPDDKYSVSELDTTCFRDVKEFKESQQNLLHTSLLSFFSEPSVNKSSEKMLSVMCNTSEEHFSRSCHIKLSCAYQFGTPLVFDMRFSLCNKITRDMMLEQLLHIVKINSYAAHPFKLYFCNVGDKNELHFQTLLTEDSNFLTTAARSYLDLNDDSFDRENLVYLSPDADEQLQSFERNKTYIIGCLSDTENERYATKTVATNEGIPCKRLPLNVLDNSDDGNALPVNKVFDIMLKLRDGNVENTNKRLLSPLLE